MIDSSFPKATALTAQADHPLYQDGSNTPSSRPPSASEIAVSSFDMATAPSRHPNVQPPTPSRPSSILERTPETQLQTETAIRRPILREVRALRLRTERFLQLANRLGTLEEHRRTTEGSHLKGWESIDGLEESRRLAQIWIELSHLSVLSMEEYPDMTGYPSFIHARHRPAKGIVRKYFRSEASLQEALEQGLAAAHSGYFKSCTEYAPRIRYLDLTGVFLADPKADQETIGFPQKEFPYWLDLRFDDAIIIPTDAPSHKHPQKFILPLYERIRENHWEGIRSYVHQPLEEFYYVPELLKIARRFPTTLPPELRIPIQERILGGSENTNRHFSIPSSTGTLIAQSRAPFRTSGSFFSATANTLLAGARGLTQCHDGFPWANRFIATSRCLSSPAFNMQPLPPAHFQSII